MTGTATQIEWASLIRPRVEAEFDRVVRVFEGVSGKQNDEGRAETLAIVAIVEEMRSAVLANRQAGYYIREWQELRDQVRHMVSKDPRYQAIRTSRERRKVNARGA